MEMSYDVSELEKEIEKYLFFPETPELKKGEIVKCRILEILDEFVIVDIGQKTEGKIRKSEIDKEKLRKGEVVEAVFLGRSADGLYKLSYRQAKERKMAEYLTKLMKERKAVHGIVIGKDRSFYEVDVGDFSGLGVGRYIALCPLSQAEDIKPGGHYEFMIKDRAKNGKFILSRKDYLRILQEEERKKVLEKLKVGAVLEGKIIRVTNLYAEIDFGGGIRGKILRDDVDWNKVESCKDFLQKGDVVKVKILETEPYIRASIKHLRNDPWQEAGKIFKQGDIIEGYISDIKSFGAFVKIKVGDDEIEALLPYSEAGWDKKELKDKFEVGQKISATIINLSPEDRKITLSLKRILPNPYDVLKQTPDKVRKAKVIEEIDRGFIVDLEVEEAKANIRAFLPRGEVSWFYEEKSSVKKGDEINVKVIAVRGKDVVVSKRKSEENVLKKIYEEIKGKVVKCIVLFTPGKKDKGLWVIFDHADKKFKGIVPVGELVSKIGNYSKGEEIKCEIIDYNEKIDTLILSESKAALKEVGGGKVSLSLGALLESSLSSTTKRKN